MAKYIFDLDNTLVFTDALNTEAYNFALRALGKGELTGIGRITRDKVFARIALDGAEKERLIALKRDYFRRHLEKVQPNRPLMRILFSRAPSDCMLWTSAERSRVEELLCYFGLKERFGEIFFSPKQEIGRDIEEICRRMKCLRSQCIFFENNEEMKSAIEHALACRPDDGTGQV